MIEAEGDEQPDVVIVETEGARKEEGAEGEETAKQRAKRKGMRKFIYVGAGGGEGEC